MISAQQLPSPATVEAAAVAAETPPAEDPNYLEADAVDGVLQNPQIAEGRTCNLGAPPPPVNIMGTLQEILESQHQHVATIQALQ